jgi:acetylornithine deacetylase
LRRARLRRIARLDHRLGQHGGMDAHLPDVTALLCDLVAIDSVNPSLVPGGAGEARIAAFVAGWARDAGLEAELLEETPGRPSALVRARGTGGGRTLLLCAHLDTVNVEGMTDPHTPRIDGDRLYGRGAYDMKAGLAAALIAARDVVGAGLSGDVVVAAVADEEHASLGVQEALRRVGADAAIVTEPTELEVAIAHKGFVWSEVRVTGRSAHGSRPHLGIDAIVKMGRVLHELGALDEALAAREHPLLGRGSVHASLISGGEELSSYPARCVLSLERRTLPGETAADVEAEVAALIGEADASQRTLLVREPFAIDPDAEIVSLVRSASGSAPVTGASYWADAAFIAAAGIPTVMYGPGGEGAHAEMEWVSVSDTERVVRTLVDVAARLCA